MPISEKAFEQLATRLMECQAMNKPTIIISVDTEGSLEWVSATNSVYETTGMVNRVADIICSTPVYVTNESDNYEN